MTRALALAVLLLMLLLETSWAQAQKDERAFAWDVARSVLLDPTTYAPAIISHQAMAWDWKTSQVLFSHGWLESNPRFTVTGRAGSAPLAYQEGRGIIFRDSLGLLRNSMLNNAGAGIGEPLLIARYPSQRRLIRIVSWTERIAYATFVTYGSSAPHIRQAKENRRQARDYGYVP